MKLLDTLLDKYLTWKTGKPKTVRDWEEWRDNTIVFHASTVENYFMNFKHIIEVDPRKVWDGQEPFGWVPVKSFQEYEYPNRKLGDNAVINWFRGGRDQWDGKFHLNEIGGGDHLFAATNNDEDAVMIALKYS